jgi:hypothetical protein
MLKFHRIAVVGDGPRVILMLMEGQIEKALEEDDHPKLCFQRRNES